MKMNLGIGTARSLATCFLETVPSNEQPALQEQISGVVGGQSSEFTAVGALPTAIDLGPGVFSGQLLRNDERPDGPCCRDYAGEACKAIYGFTDRQAYESFSIGLTQARHPYPLVRGYMNRLFDQPGLKLIVIDATGPNEVRLNATTAEEAFATQRDPSGPAATCYRLTLVAGTTEYDVERLGLCRIE